MPDEPGANHTAATGNESEDLNIGDVEVVAEDGGQPEPGTESGTEPAPGAEPQSAPGRPRIPTQAEVDPRLQIAKNYREGRDSTDDEDFSGDFSDPIIYGANHQDPGAEPGPGESDDSGDEPASEPASQPKAADPAPNQLQTDPAQQPSLTPRAPHEGEKMVALKVNGEIIEMPEGQVAEIAQMNLAGHDYLMQAKTILKTVKDGLKAPAPGIDPNAPPQPQPQPAQPDPAAAADPALAEDPDKKVKLKGLMDKIQYGDPDDAVAAFEEAITLAGAGPQNQQGNDGLSVEDVQNLMVANRDHEESMGAWQQFQSENADILKTPEIGAMFQGVWLQELKADLVKAGVDELEVEAAGMNSDLIFKAHTQARRQGLPVRKAGVVLAAARERINPYLDRGAGGDPTDDPNPQPQPQPQPQPRNVREDRKRRLATPAPSGTRPTPPPRQPAGPANRSDVVNKMRRQRGQPVA